MDNKKLSQEDKIKVTAFQNDLFRSDLLTKRRLYPSIEGQCIFSMDISPLPNEQIEEIFNRIKHFNDFNKYIDPLGERNKGRFYYGEIDKDVVWEIHCYDDCFGKKPSPDPSDITLTYRDLRIYIEPR